MDSIIFPRTGEIPLEFTGEIIFTETTDTPGKKSVPAIINCGLPALRAALSWRL